MDIVELYVIIDDFCKEFMPRYAKLLKTNGLLKRERNGMLSMSEVVLILAYQTFMENSTRFWNSIYNKHAP